MSTKIQKLEKTAQDIFKEMDLLLTNGVKSAQNSHRKKIENIFAVSGAGLLHALRLGKIISFSVLQSPSTSAEFHSLITDRCFEVCG